MSLVSILLILLSAFIHALWNYLGKTSRSTPLFFFWISVFTSALAVVAFVVRPPAIPGPVWVWIIASGVVHFAYWLALGQAYSVGEISFVYPIARSAPGFIPLFAFIFLGETLSARGVMGIVLIVLSLFLLQLRESGLTVRQLLEHARRPDSVWAFLTLATVIGYSLTDKRGMALFHSTSTEPEVWRAITFYLMQEVIAFALYGSWVMRRFPHSEVVAVGRAEWRTILTCALLVMLSYTLILFVMMTEKVSYIVALRQSSVIFAVVLGSYRLQETQAGRRLAAALVMVAGMFLVAGG